MTERRESEQGINFLATEAAIVALSAVMIAMAFPRDVKDQAIHERGCQCQRCGRQMREREVYHHHMLPESMGGNDTIDNLFIACSECHQVVDDLVMRDGVLANGLTLDEVASAAPFLIGSYSRYEKAAKRFARSGNIYEEPRRSKKKKGWLW